MRLWGWKLRLVPILLFLPLSVPSHAQTYVQSQTAALNTGGNNTATFSTQPAAGDAVVAGVVCYGPSGCTITSVTDSFNNTYGKIGPTATYGGPTSNVTNVALFCASGIATGSNFKVTATLSNSAGDSNLYIAEYSGLTCNVDQSASGSDTDSTTGTLLQTSSATTTNAADLLVSVAGSSTGGTATAGSGYHLRQNGNSGVAEYGGFEDQTVTTTGAYSGSMTVASNTSYWGIVMVALKASSSETGPSITHLSPSTGPTGGSVTITGAGFATTLTSNTVKFNGSSAIVTTATTTEIIATVPNAATTGPVTVTVGTQTSNSLIFTVDSASGGPSITSLAPSSGAQGAQITISGTGFGSAQGSGVVWLGSRPANIVSWSATQIVATVAAGAVTGNARILQNGLLSNAVPFTVNNCL